MLHASTQKLIDRLAAMTAQKKIDWIEKDNGEVIYATEGYVVRLTAEPPRILLTTESGKPLEDATSTLLKSAPHAEGGTYGDLVASIAREAYREARGTEDAINTLLAGLEDSPEAAPAAAEETEEAEDETQEEVSEDLATVSAEAIPEEALEDTGDDTEFLASGELSAETAQEPQEDVAEAADAPVDDSDTPEINEDLVDVSVPEAALLYAGATDMSYETEDDADTSDETESETEADFSSETDAETDSFEDDEDVSGAVARLAGEVNAADASADADELADETEETEASAADSDDTADFDDAADDDSDSFAETYAPEKEITSFSVMPDQGQSFDIEDDDSPESVDTLAQSDLPADAPEDATMEEVTEAAAELGDNTVDTEEDTWSETPEPAPASSEIEEPAVDEPETAPVEAVSETQEAENSSVRYVPFGAAGLSVMGADVSAERPPEEEDVSSELGAASTGMALPDDAIDADEDVADAAEAATSDEEAPSSEPEEETSVPEDVLAVDAEEPGDEAPENQPASNVMSISAFSAGLGFGATSTGFTPSSPRTPDNQNQDEQVTRAPVVIDATDDYPADFRDPETDSAPGVGGLDLPEELEEDDTFLASPAAPQAEEPAAETQNEPELETAEASTEAAPETAEESAEEEPEPVRPKTRFNPWT